MSESTAKARGGEARQCTSRPRRIREGGQLTEGRASSSVLGDLARRGEKAHLRSSNILLQVLDDGQTDRWSRTPSTSKTASDRGLESGFRSSRLSKAAVGEREAAVMEVVRSFTSARFINRLTTMS